MNLLKILIGGTVWAIYNLVYGLWLLFRHPIIFMKFANEYRRFEQKIDENDQILASGYYHLSRQERRQINRNVNKTVLKKVRTKK